MNTISRRTVLTGAALIVSTSVPLVATAAAPLVAQAGQAGDPAVAVSEQARAAWQQLLDATYADVDDCDVPNCGHSGPGCPLIQNTERCEARFYELDKRLLTTPATTPAGVLAKLRGWYNDCEIADIRAGSDIDDLPGEYAASIFCDLERISGGLPS